MTKKEQTEFEKKVLEQFMSGKNLFGEGGAFAPMLKNVIEKALEAEMDGHLDEGERTKGNNGHRLAPPRWLQPRRDPPHDAWRDRASGRQTGLR